MTDAPRPKNSTWKGSLIASVILILVASCCMIGQVAKTIPTTAESKVECNRATCSVPSQSSLPCENQVKNYVSALRSDVFPHVLEADAEAKRTRYADARFEIYQARNAFKKISIPDCDGAASEHASVYKKMLDEYWNAYAFADHDELNNANIAFALASIHRDEASRIMGLKLLIR
jgi:hypothetical protein